MLFFVIFTVSGFSGLIYESIWSHYLKLFLGHAAFAQSLVLMIFMGGLAIGAWLASRYSSRWSRPILVYAIVEAVIGLMALAFHDTFTALISFVYMDLLPNVSSPALGSTLKWSLSAALILPQSVLLGLTFPLMSAGIIRRHPDAPGAMLATLYFTNSIGAAVGVLASGFWLIGYLGLPGTMQLAGLVNIGLAAVVGAIVWLDRGSDPPAKPAAPPRERATHVGVVLLIAALITGTASFIYEIAWLRMLSMVLGGTTHSFELMLSAFISGLAFGGLWIRRRLDHIASPIRYAAFIQIFMGVFALFTLPVYLQSFEWMSNLVLALNKTDGGYVLFTLLCSAIAYAVMLPATFLAGMTLPLFTHILMQRGGAERAIGRVYAANTVGAIIGVLFAVHIGLPVLGLKNLIAVGAGLDIVLGFVLLLKLGKGVAPRHVALAITAVVVALFVKTTATLSPAVLATGVFRHGSLALAEQNSVQFYRDGKTASIALTQLPDGALMISTNGKPDATLKEFADGKPTSDAVTMIMLGAVPLAYHPDPKIIANIGMGSGLTTHTLLASPGIERVDTIEIEPAMVAGARGFTFRVRRAFNDPRSKIHFADAKTFFTLRKQKYDIIVTEPSNPWVSGVASLFSTEFYGNVRTHLTADGVFVQWLQLYEFSNELMMSVFKALSENFSEFTIYSTDDANLLILAKVDGTLGLPDFAPLFTGDMAKELETVGITSEHDLRVRQIADHKDIRSVFTSFNVPANSDYYPYLDTHAARARFRGLVANLLPELSASDLPVLEMLHETGVDFSRIAPSVGFRRVNAAIRARHIHQSFVQFAQPADDTVAPLIDLNMAQSIATLRLGASDCMANVTPDLWLATLDAVARETLPYLNPAQALEFVSGTLTESCLAQQSARFGLRLALYQAIAGRDASAMQQIARQLFDQQPPSADPVSHYMLRAGMLGALANDDAMSVLTLWDDYAAATGSTRMTSDLLLMMSLARASLQ